MVSEEATIEKEEIVVPDGKNSYELVLIAKPDIEEQGLTAVTENVSRLITEKGGVISQVEPWGKRKLAYPIKRYLEGNYILVHFRLDPAASKALEASLKITEEIIRYLIIKLSSSKE